MRTLAPLPSTTLSHPLEGAGEQRHQIPHWETAGSPQFKRARLEEQVDDEQEKTGRDETELAGPEDTLMTKSQGEPNSSTASSILDKRQYDRKTSFRQLLCTKKRNALNGTSG